MQAMDAVKSLLTPFAGSGIMDGMKLVVLGGTVETARRISSSAWNSFINSFYLTLQATEEDFPYDWLMHWLEKQPAWSRSREFETTTRNTTASLNSKSSAAGCINEDDDDEDVHQDDEDEDLTPGKTRLKVMFTPTYDTTHTVWFRGHWLRVKRSKKTDGSDVEMLTISVVARSNAILKQLVLQAKKEYEADAIHRIQIYFADSHGSWRWTDSRHKRPISSIILQPGVTEMLLADTRDFLKSEKWYADRGIPFRRGYLLYGVPGSGKSSLIQAIAGELQLDIYSLSLSSSWINDSTLTTLMGRVPARCILLLEDLDAAFTRSLTRDSSSTGSPKNKDESGGSGGGSGSKKHDDSLSDTNSLSLSGLLNALDGVAASEGRILFATTNHLERLDPALSRPGRMDVWIEFKHATKWQAEGLFRNFFPSADEEEPLPTLTAEEEQEIAGFIPDTPTPPLSEDKEEKVEAPVPSTRSRVSSLLRRRMSSASSSSASSTAASSSSPTPPPPMPSHKPPPTPSIAAHSAAPLDARTLAALAKQFADSIPEDEFSVAALQGYLLKNKSRPEAAAGGAADWVIAERALREKLRREKEERERKEREEREKRRREREEKEREEKEKKEKERAEKEEKERVRRAEEEEKERTRKAEEDAKALKRDKELEMARVEAELKVKAQLEAEAAAEKKRRAEAEENENVPPGSTTPATSESWVAVKRTEASTPLADLPVPEAPAATDASETATTTPVVAAPAAA